MQSETIEEPASKRYKIDPTTKIKIKAILPNEYTKKPQLGKVYISKLKQKKCISNLMQELSQHLPLHETLQQLKRVRQSEIIICRQIDVDDKVSLKEYLKSTQLSPTTIDIICEDITIIEVPMDLCKLRWQYEEMKKIWPCKFHPDKYYERLYDGSIFTELELKFHVQILHLLEKLSKEVENQKPCGACVDPRTRSIVSLAASRIEINPLYHCPMVLVDFVSRTQNPSNFNKQFLEDFVAMPNETNQNESLAGLLQVHANFIKSNKDFENLKFGAERVRDKCKLSTNQTFETGVDNLAKYGPYLCTGYDIYLTQEPCLMCAMALVHSRVKRVFLLNESETNGALFSKFKLQDIKELNHHYEVFQCS